MVILNFIWYCIKCLLDCLCLPIGGHIPTKKEGLVGIATLFVLIIIIFVILVLTGCIKFKK